MKVRSKQELVPEYLLGRLFEPSMLRRYDERELDQFPVSNEDKVFLSRVGIPYNEIVDTILSVYQVESAADYLGAPSGIKSFDELMIIGNYGQALLATDRLSNLVMFSKHKEALRDRFQVGYVSYGIKEFVAQRALLWEVGKYSGNEMYFLRYFGRVPEDCKKQDVSRDELVAVFKSEIELIDSDALRRENSYWAFMVSQLRNGYIDFPGLT